jgi:hypothetical protein
VGAVGVAKLIVETDSSLKGREVAAIFNLCASIWVDVPVDSRLNIKLPLLLATEVVSEVNTKLRSEVV